MPRRPSAPATHLDELRFLRTLTPPPRSSTSDSDTDYDPYRSPTPENTTGVEFDREDHVWRCTHCGWEVETIDGVQGRCVEGHETDMMVLAESQSDLTLVDGWFSTCEWDDGMWSDQGLEDGSFDGNEGRSDDEFWVFEPGGLRVEWRHRVRVGGDDDDSDEASSEDFGWIVEDEEVEDEVGEDDHGEGQSVDDVEAMSEDGHGEDQRMDDAEAMRENEVGTERGDITRVESEAQVVEH